MIPPTTENSLVYKCRSRHFPQTVFLFSALERMDWCQQPVTLARNGTALGVVCWMAPRLEEHLIKTGGRVLPLPKYTFILIAK
jgi:hypothetical protein